MKILCILLAFMCLDDLEDLRKKYEADIDLTYIKRYPTVSKIGALKTEEAATLLVEIFDKDKDTNVRRYALTAMGTCGTPSAYKKLMEVAKNKSQSLTFRSAALSAAGAAPVAFSEKTRPVAAS